MSFMAEIATGTLRLSKSSSNVGLLECIFIFCLKYISLVSVTALPRYFDTPEIPFLREKSSCRQHSQGYHQADEVCLGR